MSEPEIKDYVSDLLDSGQDSDKTLSMQDLLELSPDHIALILESLPLEQRLSSWRELPGELHVSILMEMRGESRSLLIAKLEESEQQTLFGTLDAPSLIELADAIPDQYIDLALEQMDAQQRKYFDASQKFDDDQLGHNLNQKLLLISQSLRVKDARRAINRNIEPYTDLVFLVDRIGRFAGAATVRDLLSAPEHLPVSDFCIEDLPLLSVDDLDVEAAEKVERSGFASLPVLTTNQLLAGRLHMGQCLEIIRDDYETKLMAQSGLSEDQDLFAPVLRSSKNRSLWLGINLLTVALASACISVFEGTLQQVVALAILMPIVASMGGIAGSQSLAMVIRGLTLGQISKANLGSLIRKELGVGLTNGVVWALVIAGLTWLWAQDLALAGVIAVAILANIALACISGVIIPVILDKCKIDPALSGAVILTTVTDIVGFVAFLGLGTWLLL